MKQASLQIDETKCIGCGQCAMVCPAHHLAIQDKKAKKVTDACILCGHCGAICPKHAIMIAGYDPAQKEKATKVLLDPKQVLDVLRFRRTIRRFKQDPIPQTVIQQILEAGRLSHTAENLQDVSFVVLDKEKYRFEQMAVTFFRKIKPFANLVHPMARSISIDDHFFFFAAPIVIVIVAKQKTNGILAAQNMEFVAEAHGLGVLYSGFFTIAANASCKLKKALNVPKGKKVAMALVLGYPAVTYRRAAQRKALDVTYR